MKMIFEKENGLKKKEWLMMSGRCKYKFVMGQFQLFKYLFDSPYFLHFRVHLIIRCTVTEWSVLKLMSYVRPTKIQGALSETKELEICSVSQT